MTIESAGDNSTDDHIGTEDVSLWDTSNHGSDSAMFIGSASFYCSLYRFTGLSSISSSATVNSAVPSLYVEGSFGSNNKDIVFRRCLLPWVEGEAHQTIYSTGNSWTSNNGLSDGNDRSATVSATINVIDGNDPAYFSVDDAQYAADIEDFIDGTLTNDGHHTDWTGTNAMQLTGHEGSDGQRPFVTVDFTVGGGGGWTGTINGAVDPSNVDGIAVAGITNINGVT